MALLLVSALVACGPVSEEPASAALSRQERALTTRNGLGMNGLGMNGLGMNGLGMNGLSMNGLDSTSFKSWFDSNPTLHAEVMKYVVACAVRSGESRTYTHTSPEGVVTKYVWNGNLGLAPDWSSGAPAKEEEQQVVSACLGAHANKYGISIPISLLGQTAQGVNIPVLSKELLTYSVREACFFGNLFTNEGIFVGTDGSSLNKRESSARACGLSAGHEAVRAECSPMVFVGFCGQICKRDSTGNSYVTCTYNGETYHPITTRLRPEDIYLCGDGICQFTESCGSGTEYNSCRSDCGLCP